MARAMKTNLEVALEAFGRAWAYVEGADLLHEVEWQQSRVFEEFTERDLLRESAWVILCTGFREKAVRRIFNHISLCFCDWDSSQAILATATACRAAAMASMRHGPKLDAIIEIAHRIDVVGFEQLKSRILKAPTDELRKLPYIGPVTASHLAKNLGYDTSKVRSPPSSVVWFSRL